MKYEPISNMRGVGGSETLAVSPVRAEPNHHAGSRVLGWIGHGLVTAVPAIVHGDFVYRF